MVRVEGPNQRRFFQETISIPEGGHTTAAPTHNNLANISTKCQAAQLIQAMQ
jgi:hypothetical protein